MKVLFLTNLPAPYRVKFFSELGKLCDLTVIYERHSARDRDVKWRAEAENTFKEIYLHGKEIGADNSFCPEIIKYLNNTYDVIVISMYSTYTSMLAMLWMKLKKIPYCISTDGGFVHEESKLKKWFKTFWLSSGKFWLCPGAYARDYLVYYGADKNRISYYSFTSLDQKDILPEIPEKDDKFELRKKLKLEGEKIVITVGRFIQGKGFDSLLRAFEIINTSKVRLIIIGGTEEEFQTEVCKNIPEYVTIYPFMPKADLFEYYMAADIFILPTRSDVWGLVINEAMACGLPVITTDTCGAGTVLVKDGENGYLVPVDNPDVLADRLNKLLNCDNLDKQGNASLNRIRNYTYQFMAEEHYRIFTDYL